MLFKEVGLTEFDNGSSVLLLNVYSEVIFSFSYVSFVHQFTAIHLVFAASYFEKLAGADEYSLSDAFPLYSNSFSYLNQHSKLKN